MPYKHETKEAEGDIVVARKLKTPKRFRVLLHNDDYTTMEFVIQILCTVFHKSIDEATEIMLSVHKKGIGQCGVYTQEIAETRVRHVHHLARGAGYPLKCSMEEE